MNFWQKLWGKTSTAESETNFVIAVINDRIMPIDRGVVYGDPLNSFLQTQGIAEVTGGGTLQHKSGEIANIELEIEMMQEISPEIMQQIAKKLENLGAPKGSSLYETQGDLQFDFGRNEGLAIYLDGRNLAPEVYENNDVNEVAAELKKLTGDRSNSTRYWETDDYTALYYYGPSFEQMQEAIDGYVQLHPLCKGARIEQIA